MEQLKERVCSPENTGITSRQKVKHAIIEAERYTTLGGATDELTRYMQSTEEYMFKYPRTLQDDHDISRTLQHLQQEQAQKACVEVERLLAMVYAQQARIEAEVTYDNWARDYQPVMEFRKNAILKCHKTLRDAAEGARFYYY